MNPRPPVLSSALALTLVGCSALFELNVLQCEVDDDCAKYGSAYPICGSGVCVVEDELSAGGTGPTGSGGEAGEASHGGDAGSSAGPPECASNAECIDGHFGQPYLCRAGRCVSLITDECPLVVGADNLRAAEPIVFGAYALAPDAVSKSTVTRNLELVVGEFTSKVTGLRGGPDGSRRTLAFVICNSYFPEIAPGTIDAFEPSLSHLIDTLEAPGILSALSSKDLQAVFGQRLDRAGTFVISPYEQDSELAALADGRLWHMLGATADLAPAFGPLLERTDEFLRLDDSFLKLPEPGAKLRVAIVTANIARELDVRDALLQLPELEHFEVDPFQIQSALIDPAPDVSAVSNDLLDFAPHIIVALAGSEFIEGVFPVLESGGTWSDRTGGQRRPMYVLGAAMAPQTWSLYASKQGDPGGWKTFFDRLVGIAYASAADTRLLNAYELRMIEANQDLSDPSLVLGSESVYDAAYLMIYAAAAASDVQRLTGRDLASGMRRLVQGTSYDIGPSSISKVLTALDRSEDVALNLTLGPPDWDIDRGTRSGVGSVYCINNGLTPFERELPQGPNRDVLRYYPEQNILSTQALRCIPEF